MLSTTRENKGESKRGRKLPQRLLARHQAQRPLTAGPTRTRGKAACRSARNKAPGCGRRTVRCAGPGQPLPAFPTDAAPVRPPGAARAGEPPSEATTTHTPSPQAQGQRPARRRRPPPASAPQQAPAAAARRRAPQKPAHVTRPAAPARFKCSSHQRDARALADARCGTIPSAIFRLTVSANATSRSSSFAFCAAAAPSDPPSASRPQNAAARQFARAAAPARMPRMRPQPPPRMRPEAPSKRHPRSHSFAHLHFEHAAYQQHAGRLHAKGQRQQRHPCETGKERRQKVIAHQREYGHQHKTA